MSCSWVRVREARVHNGISIGEAARFLGCSVTDYSAMERGRSGNEEASGTPICIITEQDAMDGSGESADPATIPERIQAFMEQPLVVQPGRVVGVLRAPERHMHYGIVTEKLDADGLPMLLAVSHTTGRVQYVSWIGLTGGKPAYLYRAPVPDSNSNLDRAKQHLGESLGSDPAACVRFIQKVCEQHEDTLPSVMLTVAAVAAGVFRLVAEERAEIPTGRPISPSEVLPGNRIPELVLNTVNALIAKNFDGQAAVVHQDILVARILENNPAVVRCRIFDLHWLDFEPLYRNAGWFVKYSKENACWTFRLASNNK